MIWVILLGFIVLFRILSWAKPADKPPVIIIRHEYMNKPPDEVFSIDSFPQEVRDDRYKN